MPTDAARKQAHLEWYNHSDEESWSDEERWRDLEPDDYSAFLAEQEATLHAFKRDFLRIGPLRPSAEELGTHILRSISKALVRCKSTCMGWITDLS